MGILGVVLNSAGRGSIGIRGDCSLSSDFAMVSIWNPQAEPASPPSLTPGATVSRACGADSHCSTLPTPVGE